MEKMKKENKKKKWYLVLIVLLLIILALGVMAGNGFSKYLMEVKGKGIVEVANWSFLVNGQSSSIQNIQLAQTYTPETLVENTIAPGTSGAFDIVIDATGSQVGIAYQVQFQNEVGKPTNMQFECNGKTVSHIKDLEEVLIGEIAANEEQKVKTYTIHWQWPYETGSAEEEIQASDKVDTKEASEIANYAFDIIINGTQIEPRQS